MSPPPPRIPREPVKRSLTKAEARAARSDAKHLALLRQLPCAATGAEPSQSVIIEPHHLYTGEGVVRGMGMKSEDKWTIPLRREVHARAHARKEDEGSPEDYLTATYWIQPRELATALWAASPDPERMREIIVAHWQRAQLRMKRAA